MVRQVQPLRISKTNNSNPLSSPMSPGKTAASRPLAEIGSTEWRRNSPSYNQATRKNLVSHDSSPYNETSSPPQFKPSPKDFWSGREGMSPIHFDSENTPERSPSPSCSPRRRPSIERLMQAGRVKTSNMFAMETKDTYDPNSYPHVERPAANRPLSQQLANNSFTRFDSLRKENHPMRPGRPSHKRSETESSLPILSPSKAASEYPLPESPLKQEQQSPTKSALSRTSQFGPGPYSSYDDENRPFSAGDDRVPTPRSGHRHAKSVTFHAEPPEVTHYEQQTPEPSVSVGSDRDGSWDSEDFDEHDYSFDRGSSADMREDSFDADLENLDKTPVVLPDDWRRMSPDNARADLAVDEDNVFGGEETPRRAVLSRSESVTSDGSSRPLPPLPGMTPRKLYDSNDLQSAAERAAQSTRNLPSPPKRASCSKDEILKMTRQASLSLEERLQLMREQDERPMSKSSQQTGSSAEQELTITNLDTGEQTAFADAQSQQEQDDSLADLGDFDNDSSIPKISRESILRKVRNAKYDSDDEFIDESEVVGEETSPGRPSIAELARMDPDQPVPSRENSRETSENYLSASGGAYDEELEEEVSFKREESEDDSFDMNAIPSFEDQKKDAQHPSTNLERQGSVVHYPMRSENEYDDDDTASKYSSEEPEAESTMIHEHQETYEHHETVEQKDDGKETLDQAMELLTVNDYSKQPAAEDAQPTKQGSGDFSGLPTYLSADDYDFGMKKYITPSPPPVSAEETKLDEKKMPNLLPPAELDNTLQPPRPAYADAEPSPPGTPESVIHHGDDGDVENVEDDLAAREEQTPRASPPAIPERSATIKTQGKLKARPSVSQAELEALAERHRTPSEEPPVPAIPQQYSAETESESEQQEEAEQDLQPAEGEVASIHSSEDASSKADSLVEEKPQARRKSRKSGAKMDLNLDQSAFDDMSMGLDQEFDRVIESQKKGYLTRQNTKVVVASNRNISGDSNNTNKSHDSSRPLSPTNSNASASGVPRTTSRSQKSPRKPSAEQYLKTEPWNPKARRKSQRAASAQKAYKNEPAPPLPGQESALGVVDEDYAAGSGNLEDEVADGVERGRLFVKVVGVRDLDLPLPRNDRVYFQLTLDNGLHCVTTANLELGRSAPIGQEFELVVLNDLEFQLTLNTKLPAPPVAPMPTPSTPTQSPQKSHKSTFSRLLSSPKKRAEKERQEREAIEAEDRRQQAEAQRKRASHQPTAWDLLHELVNGSDGSFARAYVNLKAHEGACFGRPLTVDVPCYNEWAQEKDGQVVNSVRSKRGNNAGPIRKPPYVVGKLELQLLYVPKPKGAGDEDMPKSMSSAIREMNKASETKEVVYESHLSQQGGDCVHWRRRYFRLTGPKLTAYHEHTHQKRAVINLTKASRLVDDRSTLVADPNPSHASPTKSRPTNRRRSAFAEEDEGYQYVEEGFRIRFQNGETIDFYADSRAQKERWMEALSQVIGVPDPGKKKAGWTDLVLKREKGDALASRPAAPHGGVRGEGTEVRDFETNLAAPEEAETKTARPATAVVNRKPVAPLPGRAGSRTAPNSPQKGAGAMPLASPGARPRTPPMKARTGHRGRDAVKSMIF